MICVIRQNIKNYIFVVMFKSLIAAIFLVTFVVQSFSGPFIMLDYVVNTAAYAKSCVNKAKPKLHCNGKCQMMKRMREEEKKDQQGSERKSENKVQVLSSRSFFSVLTIPPGYSSKIIPYEVTTFPVDRALNVFHPPQA